MKTRLTLAITLGLASCLALAAQTTEPQSTDAQSTPASKARHSANPAVEAKHLAKKLNLSDDQVQKLQPILADRAQQRSALLSDTTLGPKDRRAKMVSLRQDFDAKIKAILTADQQQKYDQLRQEMHDRMAQRRQAQKS